MTEFLKKYENCPNELSIKQAHEVTGIPAYTLKRAIVARKLSAFRVGRMYMIPKSSLRRYILLHLSAADGDEIL